MNAVNSIFILVLAFLAVFMEASFGGFRRVLSVQVDVLPGLMIYAALSSGMITVSLLATLGGLWFDSLSANRLGVSIVPLFLIGVVVQQFRHLILRDQTYAQLVLGFTASGFAPLLTLVILFSCGAEPMVGWGFVWQWFVMTLLGGLLVPLYFRLFDKVYATLGYERIVESSFRQDREIARGRK
jgi:cell shape-determining protein MreD